MLCSILSALFVLGIMVMVGSVAALFYAARHVCRPRLLLRPDGYLVLSFGSCGELRIPTGSIRSAYLVSSPGKGVRLFGVSMPGLHVGYYKFSEIGAVNLYTDRRSDFVVLELENDKKVGLGFSAEKYLDEIRRLAGSGPRGDPVLETRAGRLAGIGLLFAVAGLAVLLAAYPHMAPACLLFGSRTARTDLLVAGLVLGVTHVMDTVLIYALASDNPLLPVIAPFTGLGSFIVEASLALIGIMCPVPLH